MILKVLQSSASVLLALYLEGLPNPVFSSQHVMSILHNDPRYRPKPQYDRHSSGERFGIVGIRYSFVTSRLLVPIRLEPFLAWQKFG